MKSAEVNIYIDEASLDFYEKLDFFHEHFIDKMLMCGVSNNGTHVEEIPFTKCAREYNYDFYKALVFLVQRFKPFCISKLTNKKRLELEWLSGSILNLGKSVDLKSNISHEIVSGIKAK